MQNNTMTIRRYNPDYEDQVFAMIEREGKEWNYWQPTERKKYKNALENCIVYLGFEDGILCGYARCWDDYGLGVYVLDLLVDKKYRGKEYGRLLMEEACKNFPDSTVYVNGDVYPYYDKLGYEKAGIIYVVKTKQ